MPLIKISNSSVGKIELPKPTVEGKKTQIFYRDEQLMGFGLRITSGGARAYFVETRIDGRNKRITIGRHGQITPEQARKEAKRL